MTRLARPWIATVLAVSALAVAFACGGLPTGLPVARRAALTVALRRSGRFFFAFFFPFVSFFFHLHFFFHFGFERFFFAGEPLEAGEDWRAVGGTCREEQRGEEQDG